jgi:hypothetical protein
MFRCPLNGNLTKERHLLPGASARVSVPEN